MSVLDLINPFRKLKNQTEVDGKVVVTPMPTVSEKYIGVIEAFKEAEIKIQQCITNGRFTKKDIDDYLETTDALNREYLINYKFLDNMETAFAYKVDLQEIVDMSALRLGVETISKTKDTISKMLADTPSVCKLYLFRMPRRYKMRPNNKPKFTLKRVKRITGISE